MNMKNVKDSMGSVHLLDQFGFGSTFESNFILLHSLETRNS